MQVSQQLVEQGHLTPFLFGWCSYFVLKFWKIAKRSCLLTLFHLWVCFVWFGIMWLMLIQTPQTFTFTFLAGFFLAFSLKMLTFIGYLKNEILLFFQIQADKRRANQWEREYQKQQKQNSRQNQNQQWNRTREAEEEQARREEEARNYRKRQSSAGQEQEKKKQYQKQSQSQREKTNQGKQHETTRQEEEDTRSYEQILGLQSGWTEEDLKKAYQRECQRTHPDKWVGKSESLRKIMEEEYKAVQEAYRELKK